MNSNYQKSKKSMTTKQIRRKLKQVERDKKRLNILKIMKVTNRKNNTGMKSATKKDKETANKISSVNYYGCSDDFILDHMQKIVCILRLYLDKDTSSIIYDLLLPTMLTRDKLIYEMNYLIKTKIEIKYIIYISPDNIKILRVFDKVYISYDNYRLIISTHSYNLICYQLVCSNITYDIESCPIAEFKKNEKIRFYCMDANNEKYVITIM